MFSWLFCFVQVKALKSFSEKLYTSTIKKKRRSRGENCLHSCATSFFWTHFDVTCDLGGQLLNRHMKTWNLLLLNWYCTTEKCRVLAIITKLINKSWENKLNTLLPGVHIQSTNQSNAIVRLLLDWFQSSIPCKLSNSVSYRSVSSINLIDCFSKLNRTIPKSNNCINVYYKVFWNWGAW